VRRGTNRPEPRHRASENASRDNAEDARFVRLESTVAELMHAVELLNVRLAALQAQVDHAEARRNRI